MAFLLAFKNIPLVYYGDELGIQHNFEVSKDGGCIRTGTRTPMQWTKGRNRGFTTSRSPYLPTWNTPGQSVEEQLADPDSLLNCTKDLIAMRKTCPALFTSAKQTFLETGYPAVYIREGGGQKITVLLNPSNETYTREVPHSKVLKAQNIEVNGATITLKPQSFAILEN
jgi:maltose alpha-D-glucosyltransferase/alpha-amylase